MTHDASKHAPKTAEPPPEPLAPLPGVDEFMSVAVHDLRNPIAVVRASAQMASRQLRQGNTDAVENRLQAIVQQTDRLSEMLERFLDAARVGTGALPFRRDSADFALVVRDAVDRARRLLGTVAERPIQVEVPASLTGFWDAVRLERAVHALVENAYVYGAADEPVLLRAAASDGALRLTVSGGGPGPREGEESEFFRPFFRGRAAAEAGHAGSGLGLFTARGIARAHGGDVRWAGPGAPDTFEMTLPLEPPPA